MLSERGVLKDFMKYGVVFGVAIGLIGGVGLVFVLSGSDDPSDRRPCVQPPDQFTWNSTQPDSAQPIQTLSGEAVIPSDDGPRYRVEFQSQRTRNSSVFSGVSHDNDLARHNGTTYLLSQYHCAHMYSTESDRVPMTADGWEVERTDVFYGVKPPGESIDTLTYADGSWYGYYNRSVVMSDSLHGNWTWFTSLPKGVDDTGVYYENGTFHLFYEAGNTSGLSGTTIGHATSPNGYSDWTVHEPVYRSEDGYKTGDYEIVKRDGVYLIFADHTKEHPNYDVALFATTELGSNLTHVGSVATPFRNSSTQPERGIQDATVIYDDTREKFVLYAHVHEERRRAHAATIDISVESRQPRATNTTAG